MTIPITLGAVQLRRATWPARRRPCAALTREPSNHEAHFYLARVKAKRSEYTQRHRQHEERAWSGPPSAPTTTTTWASSTATPSGFAEAIEEWKKALELDPKNADALEALGQAYLDRGEIDDAIESFEAALKADPKRTARAGRHRRLRTSRPARGTRPSRATRRRSRRPRSSTLRLLQAGPRLLRAGRSTPRPSTGTTRRPRSSRTTPMPYYYLGFAYKERGQEAARPSRPSRLPRAQAQRRGQEGNRGRDLRPRAAAAAPATSASRRRGSAPACRARRGDYKPPAMLDLKYVAQNFDAVVARLKTRGGNLDLGPFQKLFTGAPRAVRRHWRRCPPGATPPTRR